MKNELVEKHWDYSEHAEFYEYRPNYSNKAIDTLCCYVSSQTGEDYCIADIGAGTGNLSIMLLERNLHVVAVEPNDGMRNIGIERTRDKNQIKWIKANGVETTLDENSADWVTYGSSFNVMDRTLALKEAHRILKKGGHFSCVWNHRQLNDPIQEIAENTIVEYVPDYDRGVRRQDQRPVIEEHSELFKNIFYLEVDFDVERTIDTYIKAWKSVKNKYWDVSKEEGSDLFQKITDKLRERMPKNFSIRYTTRAWTAQKVD